MGWPFLLVLAFAVVIAIMLTRGRTGRPEDAMRAWLRVGLLLFGLLVAWLVVMLLLAGPAVQGG